MNTRASPSAAPSLSPSPSSAVLLACCLAFVVVQLDITIVNVALPRIGAQLHAGVAGLQWVVDAYTLGFAVFLLSAGVLGDRFGSRRIFLAGFALFAAASLACALAPTAITLNLARAVQGLAAALLVPNSLAILNAVHAHDKLRLAKAVALWSAAGGVAIAAGPVLGGLLLSVGGWRGIFWVNLPICIAGFWLTRRVVPALAGRDARRAFDLPGQLLAVVALTALVGAVIEFASLGAGSPLIQGALALAVAASALFLWVEKRSAAPMLPLSLFAGKAFSGAVLFGVLMNLSYYGVIFVLSFYLQQVRGFSVLHAGLVFLPLTGTFILSNLASGRIAGRTGLRLPMIWGGLIGAAGYALLGGFGIAGDASFVRMLPGLALIPAGMGLAVPAMTTSILSGVAPGQAGTTSAVLNTARQVGGAVGVAIFGALVAGGSPERMMSGIRLALAVSCALLLMAAALAAWCIARPAHAQKTAQGLAAAPLR